MSDIYVDESSQTQHRFLALGALIIPTAQVAGLHEKILEARKPELPNGEMKWSKVSSAKLPAYKRVIDTFFSFSRPPHRTEFHCLYVDTSLLRDRKFNKGSREIGFNKEIFQIVRKCALIHKARLLHVYLDNRNTDSTPEELRFMLNRHLKNNGDQRDWPFRRIHFRDSKGHQCIQLVDVLLGAVAFQLNGHAEKPDASPSKKALAEYIRRKVPYHTAHLGTHKAGKFTIWVSVAEPTSWRVRCSDLNSVTLRLGVGDVTQATW